MKAVGYLRVSTEEQAQEGISLAAQRASIEAWAKAKKYQLVAVHADEGISGKRAANRPGLQAALVDVVEAKGVLVFYSLSRFARNTAEAILLSEKLDKAGANVASITEELNTTTAMGRAFFGFMAIMATLEREQTGERIRHALAHKRATKKKYCYMAPYGYRWDNDAMITVPTEQQVVKLMQKWRAKGVGYKTIAQRLNDQGVVSRSGRPWRWTSARSVLTNRMREQECGS